MAFSGYCSVANVQSLTQPSQSYGTGTKPTATDVEGFIENIYGELNSDLRSMGYTMPITGADALIWLRLANSLGAAGLAEDAIGGTGNADVSSVGESYWSKYQAMRTQLQTKPGLLFDGSAASIADQARALWTSHSCDGSDDKYSDISPWVTRDKDF